MYNNHTITSPYNITEKGIQYTVDGYKYFMYFSDTSHLYDINSGKKRRISMSNCGEDSPLRRIYVALQKAMPFAKRLIETVHQNGKKLLLDIENSVGQIVIVREQKRSYKIHIFKFYQDGRALYNQGIEDFSNVLRWRDMKKFGHLLNDEIISMVETFMCVFYRDFRRCGLGFGYQEYLDIAREQRKEHGKEQTIIIDESKL